MVHARVPKPPAKLCDLLLAVSRGLAPAVPLSRSDAFLTCPLHALTVPVEGEGDALGASSVLVELAGTVVEPSQDAGHRSRTEGRTEHEAADLAARVEQVVRTGPQFVVVNREQPDVELSAYPS